MASTKSERLALVTASQDLAANPWRETGGANVVSVLFGKVAETERDRAVATYLDAIPGKKSEKVTVVMADVDHALAQARRVAEAGRQAATSITPVETDIITLEAAIGDVRECRTMYTRALEALADHGAPIGRTDIRIVRDAFTQTINDIGHTADIVASRMRDADGQTRLATPRLAPEPSLP